MTASQHPKGSVSAGCSQPSLPPREGPRRCGQGPGRVICCAFRGIAQKHTDGDTSVKLLSPLTAVSVLTPGSSPDTVRVTDPLLQPAPAPQHFSPTSRFSPTPAARPRLGRGCQPTPRRGPAQTSRAAAKPPGPQPSPGSGPAPGPLQKRHPRLHVSPRGPELPRSPRRARLRAPAAVLGWPGQARRGGPSPPHRPAGGRPQGPPLPPPSSPPGPPALTGTAWGRWGT